GTRVYTNLASGLIDVPPRTFLLGMLPASAIWVSVIFLLGALAGNRARPYLVQFEGLSLYALALLVALFASYLVLRYVPDLRHRRQVPRPAAPVRAPAMLLSLAVDVVIVGAVAALVLALVLGPLRLAERAGVATVAVVVVATALIYALAARLGPGSTTGEALLRVDYHRVRA
ncbi:MAG: hypothetical protein J2P38_06730, partial [Candidatus Dormibacteraeota bacterium]|nr:hypothetical protein [Candidatus Dormibacteraeota bacterium]